MGYKAGFPRQPLLPLSEEQEKAATEALKNKTPLSNRVFNNAKVSDHFAIIPTKETYPVSKLKPEEQKIYDLVSRRFLSIFFDPAIYQETWNYNLQSSFAELFRNNEKYLY